MENTGKSKLRSMSAKMGIFILALLCISLTTITLVLVSRAREAVKEATDDHMSDMANSHAETVALAIKNMGGIDKIADAPAIKNVIAHAELKGIEGSYVYIVGTDGKMIFHPSADKIGQPVENASVKDVVKRIQGGENVAPFTVEYEYRGGTQYAAIHPNADQGFIIVVVAPSASVMDSVDILRRDAIFMNVVGCVLFAAIGVAFTIFMLKPLQGVTAETERMIKLDFSANPQLEKLAKHKDEIGMIAQAIKSLQGNLNTVIEDIKMQTDDLYTASETMSGQILETAGVIEQVSTAVQEIAEGASSQAEDTQVATEQVVKMGNAVEKTNIEVGNLYQSTGAVKTSGDEAVQTLKELMQINQSARKSIDVIAEQTNMTNESVQKIHAATSLITEIAEETNLLSLNASIEAARAGEAGRGFAVVAAQIQKLAEQSNASASQIEQIIGLLTENSEKAVATMQEVIGIMQKQEENVSKTEQIVLDVRQKIDQSIEGVGVIAESTNHIDETRKAVIDLVQNLSAIAEENAANTEETSASVTEVGATMGSISDNTAQLKNIAEQLEGSMNKFKL